MSNTVVIKFTGGLAPNDQITARTLAHSMDYFQRAVDKIVINQTRSLKKYDSLSAEQYIEADFTVMQFEHGCIQIPLVNQAADYIASKIREVLHEPYELAISRQDRLVTKIKDQIPYSYNRAILLNPEQNNQESLIDNDEVERSYADAAIVGELNKLISPVRSKVVDEDDQIILTVTDQQLSKQYVFNKQISNNFNTIVSARKLGPEAAYRGFLIGLEETKSKEFPYAGKFISSITNFEMKLLIHSSDAMNAIREYNLAPRELVIWAAPMTRYGAFDEKRGDIVFLELV